MLTIKAQYFDITFVNGHASTEEKTQEKDKFYGDLEHVLNKIIQSKIRIMPRDFNAKLEKEIIFRSTISNHSLHDVTSENELRLIDITIGGELMVKSTIFPHKETWNAPNCIYVN